MLAGSAGSLAATRYDELSVFTSVLNLVRRNYVEPVEEDELVRGALRGMLAELDPHSSFLDAEAYKEMQVDTKGEFHGLGIEISKRKDGYVEVVSPIEGTPAAQAGIRARDQITAICPTEVPEDWTEPCRSSKNMTLFEAVNLMRGKKGSKITIEIFREGFERPQPFEITRDVVKVVSVSGRMLEPQLRLRAPARLPGAHRRGPRGDARRTCTASRGEPFQGLVLDLRDNPGGLLDQAVKVADNWLKDGLVVYTKGRDESQRQEFRAHLDGTEPSYPIVVLVNEGTASASEIVAGALQDHGRALVIGVKTFGKGSVQTVYPLEGGAGLRLTTALYYTPAGRSIQEVGITPDIPVQPVVVAAAGEAAPSRIRERDLEGHFTQQDATPQTQRGRPEPAAARAAAAAGRGRRPARARGRGAEELDLLRAPEARPRCARAGARRKSAEQPERPQPGAGQPQPAAARRVRRTSTRVGDLLAGLRGLLEERVGRLWVAGEISNLHRAGSGHLYFTLKDERGQVRAALFRSAARRLAFEPENGLEVIVYADVTVYEARGDLQLVVRELEPRGAGALQLAFEQLRRRLEAEGLFDAARKRGAAAAPRLSGRGRVADQRGAARRAPDRGAALPGGADPDRAHARAGGGRRARDRRRPRRARRAGRDRRRAAGARGRLARGPAGVQQRGGRARDRALAGAGRDRGRARGRRDASRIWRPTCGRRRRRRPPSWRCRTAPRSGRCSPATSSARAARSRAVLGEAARPARARARRAARARALGAAARASRAARRGVARPRARGAGAPRARPRGGRRARRAPGIALAARASSPVATRSCVARATARSCAARATSGRAIASRCASPRPRSTPPCAAVRALRRA